MTIGTPVNQGHSESASTASLNNTTLAPISKGDLIKLFHYCNSGTGTVQGAGAGIVDPAGSTYKIAISNNTAPVAQILYAIAAADMPAGSTITTPFSVAGLRHAISIVSTPIPFPAVDVITNSVTGTATSSATLNFPALAQAQELDVIMIATAVALGAVTWSGNYVGIGGNTATAFALPAWQLTSDPGTSTASASWVNSGLYRMLGCSFMSVPPSGATAGVKSKNKGKRVWRVMLPDGKIVICDSPTEYYNLLTRAVNEATPAAPVSAVKLDKLDKLAETLEPERPKQPLLKLRPAEKREALNWAAAENMAVNLRALADSIRAARTPIADNDDDEAAELLRWVI